MAPASKLPGGPDERQARRVLLGTRGLAHHHQVRAPEGGGRLTVGAPGQEPGVSGPRLGGHQHDV